MLCPPRSIFYWLTIALMLLAGSISPTCCRAGEKDAFPVVHTLTTPDGVAFAMLGDKPAAPAPTLFVFGGDMNPSLKSEDVNKLGRLLIPHGYVCVSLDLPGHGADVRADEQASGLAAWKGRIVKGENIAATFARKVSQVLDYLIAKEYTDPKRVAVSGTSRGGFIAFHCAAADPRIRQVIAFAPVTRLLTLTEFAGTETNEAVMALSTIHLAEKLVGKPMWVVIGNHDTRVGTEDCLAFSQEVIKRSIGKLEPVPVELRLVGTTGHRLHASPAPEFGQLCAPHDEAAAWLLAQAPKK
jgi:dienelactone hydrolase